MSLLLRTLGAVALVVAPFSASSSLEEISLGEVSLLQEKIHMHMWQPEAIALAKAHHKGPGNADGFCRPVANFGRGDRSAGALLQSGLAEKSSFNCTRFPEACQEPFNCQNPPVRDSVLLTQLVQDGHPYYRFWCQCWADYLPIVQECLVNNNEKKYVEMIVEIEEERGLSDNDAGWCFNSGACDDNPVSGDTTLEEMEAICDERWPGWRHVGFANLTYNKWMEEGLVDPDTRILQPGASEPAAMMARVNCAVAEIKCDMMHCKDYYCKQPKYIEIYRGN